MQRKRTPEELERIKKIEESSPFATDTNLHHEFVKVRIQRMDCEIAAREAAKRNAVTVPVLGTIGEKKYDEFWFYLNIGTFSEPMPEYGKGIHLIEFSAYQEALDKIKELEKFKLGAILEDKQIRGEG